jgi:hypothetical protein
MKFRRSTQKDKQKEIKPCLGYTNCCPECAKHVSDTLVWEPETVTKSGMERQASNLTPIEMDLLASIEKDKPQKKPGKLLQRDTIANAHSPVHQELTQLLRSLSSVMHFKTGAMEDDKYGPGNGGDPNNIKRAWGSARIKEHNGVLVGAGAGSDYKPITTPRNPRTKRVSDYHRFKFKY